MAPEGVKEQPSTATPGQPVSNGNGQGANGQHESAEVESGTDIDPAETKEWLDSLEAVLQTSGPERARFLLTELKQKANRSGIALPWTANTPYINTIHVSKQPRYPG